LPSSVVEIFSPVDGGNVKGKDQAWAGSEDGSENETSKSILITLDSSLIGFQAQGNNSKVGLFVEIDGFTKVRTEDSPEGRIGSCR
jgi:hypothetical protein